MAALAILGLLHGLMGCRFENPDLRDVASPATGTAFTGPDCASCHAYPLRDTNHVYHLFETDGSIANYRPITCLHCHNRSIAGRDTTYQDTVFAHPEGAELHSLDFPDIPEIRAYRLVRIEPLVRNRPVPMPPRPGPLPEMTEWMTALAHMNGKVDVDFDASSNDTARFRGANAVYNPQSMNCSAMACHPAMGPYRWAVPSRNIPILKGDSIGPP